MENLFQFFESFYIPKLSFLDFIEILIIITIIYNLEKNLKSTRAWVIIKGIIVLALIYLSSLILGLSVIETLFQGAISICLISLIILFEPEIKKFLEELGNHSIQDIVKIIKNRKPITNKRYSDNTIKEILEACATMSEAKTGALIILEQDSILNEYISTGININADISSQLLINIFEHNTPLHDGAVIIKKDKIIAATCYLPLSENNRINKKLGTRHRAGIGLSETTDAIVIIVSEETGKISLVKDGNIKHGISIDNLHNLLNEYQIKKENISIKDGIIKHKHNIKKKGIKDRISHNFLSKIFCTGFGLFIWAAIINSQDPLMTKTFTVPVVTENETALNEVGKTFEIIEGDYVDVKITATRSIINNLKENDIVATADFQKLSYTYAVPIEATIPSLNESQYDIDTNSAALILELDEIAELNIDLQIESIGNCEDGYYVQNLTSNTNTIDISGAQSIIKTIEKAIVKVNIDNKKDDFTETYVLEIYDKNGNKLNNDDFNISTTQIIINGTISPTKEIPINISLKNDITNNYKLLNYDIDLNDLIIAGNKDDLDEIDEINIEVDISKEQIKESYIKTINLYEYLPENIDIANSSNKLNITMNFEIYVEKEFEINVNDIKINNLQENLKCDFKDEKIKIKFKGLEKDINSLNLSSLEFYLDLSNLNTGKYNLPLKINNLPKGINLSSDGNISLSIIKEK